MLKERVSKFIEALSFHPLAVWLTALFVASIYAIYSLLKFSGDKLFNQFYYVVPIIFPFVLFLAERAARVRRSSNVQTILDFLVVLIAIWRVIGDVPFVSGHSLIFNLCGFHRSTQAVAADGVNRNG